MPDKKGVPEGAKPKMSTKKKVILSLVGVSILVFGGYVTIQKVEKYGDARDHMTPEQIEFHKKNSESYHNF